MRLNSLQAKGLEKWTENPGNSTRRLREQLRPRDKGLWLALIIPLIGILPMFGEGLANGADAPFHAHRIFAMARLIEAGDLYPRWAPYFHLGYGYPVFTYYAPGATHIGAWLHLLGFDVVTAYTLTCVLAWCIGSLGIWLLARQFLPVAAALLACVLWVYAPSRFYEFWWQGSLAQIVSTSFIPFIFYGILSTRRVPNLRASLWLALPLAAVVLTHTPTAYIVLIFAIPFCLAAAFASRTRREAAQRLLFICIGLALGLGLSAIFWLPVGAELQYVKIGGELRDTVDFLKHEFLSLGELLSFPQLIDGNDATLLMARTLGPVGAVLSAIGGAALLIRRRFGAALLLLIGLAAAILLTLEPSFDFWLSMPGFRNLRFPARIIRLAALIVALLGASSLLLLPARWRTLAAFALSAAAIAQALPIMHPRDDDRVWRELSARDEIVMEYRERNWGTTAYNEFRPIWGAATSFDLPQDLDSYLNAPLQIRVYSSDFARRHFDVSYQYQADNQILITARGRAVELRLRQFYMPGWRLTVDGEAYPFEADDRFGLIQFHLPEGAHLVQLDYVGTPIQHLAALVSLASVCPCLLIIRFAAPSLRPPEPEPAIPMSAALLTGGGIVVFAALNAFYLQDNVFRIVRVAGKPVYMQQDARASFDDAVTLLGYTLAADYVAENEPLAIRLYWRREAALEVQYEPVVQLVDLQASGAWAVSQPGNFEGGSLSDIAPGQFMSDGHKLKLTEHAPAYIGRISIQLLNSDDSGAFAKLPDGSDRYLLPDIIKIIRPGEAFRGASQAIDLGGFLTLHCIETMRKADALSGTLHWEVIEQPALDLHQFVHGLDEAGEVITQNDGEPLPGLYPMSHWRAGQHITSDFSLAIVDGVAQVAFGLYDPSSGARVPVMLEGAAADRILLAPDDAPC